MAHATESFDYYIAAGDGRSSQYHAEVVKRPRIETVNLGYLLPSYTARPPYETADSDVAKTEAAVEEMADSEVVEATGGWDKVLKILKKTVLKKPDNIVFGTDWPMCPIDKHIELIKEMKLGTEMEEKIFFLNAVNLFKLEIL